VAFKVADLAKLGERLELLDITESKLDNDVIEGLVGGARNLSMLLGSRSRYDKSISLRNSLISAGCVIYLRED
jgi:hypothetical protein